MEAAMTKVFAVAVSLLTISLGTVALSFKTIDVKAGALSVTGTAAQGINDRGDVVGFLTLDKDSKGHAYMVRKGVVTFLKAPGTLGVVNETTPRAINASGDIVGELSLADGSAHGFLRDHQGKWTSLDVPGAEGATLAFGINGQGEIVGAYSNDDWNTDHGFLFRPGHHGAPGSYLPFDYPGASSAQTEPYGINDDGDVVGVYAFESDWIPHGFLQHEGDFTTIDVPGAQGTMARSINSRGEIVGQYWDADWAEHGFLLSKGTYTTFDVPGAVGTRPRSINDHGEIVGNYNDEGPVTHSFKAVRAH
jgi:uncharacterized membrane protein